MSRQIADAHSTSPQVLRPVEPGLDGGAPDALVGLVADRLRVLGQPVRLRIVVLLLIGERSVQQLADEIGATQQNVSHHLGLLQGAGVVRRRPEGARSWYSLASGVAAVVDAAAASVVDQLRELGGTIDQRVER